MRTSVAIYPRPRAGGPEPAAATIRDLPSAERPRERLLSLGPGALTNSELIAILLRTGMRGENVLALASRLLTAHSGLHGLLQASAAELCALRGISAAKAAQLCAALELGRRAVSLVPEERALIRVPADLYRLIGPQLAHLTQEKLCAILLNTKQEVVRVCDVYQGTVDAASVRIAEVLRPAIKDNCPNLIVAHNHPSGDPTPSPQDIRITRRLVASAAAMDIDLQDHMVIGARGYISMKERGLGFESAG